MKNMKKIKFVLLLILLGGILAGCGFMQSPATESATQPISTSVEEVEEEPIIQEDSDASSKITVTDIEQITGTWIAPAYPGNFVLTVFPDGKLSVATSLEDLEKGSTDSWNLTIEDGQITATDFALCLGDIGLYVGEIDKEGNLRFISIIDACDARIRKMDRSLPGRLYPYILIYRPVE